MHKTLLVCLSLASFLAVSMLYPKPVRAQVKVAPTSLSFGNVAVNTTSSPKTFVVTNESSQPRSILRAYSSVPEFIVIGPAMPLTLAAHSSASFQVKFVSTSALSFSGEIVVNMENSKGQTSRVYVRVGGTATTVATSSAPALTYLLSTSTSSLTFSNTLVGTSASQTISLTNGGTGAVTISQAAISGAGFALSGFSGAVTLAAGNGLTLTVSFAPTATGTVAGSLTITSNASNSSATIPLSGAGVQPQISVAPASVTFANVSVGMTNTQSLTIRNTGTANLTISQASLAGTSFTYSGLALPLSLAPGGSSTFTVGFTPASASSFYANLSLTSNSPSSPLVVPLAGTSVAPVLQLSASPTSLTFGNITTGTNSTQIVTLTNSGNSSVTISSINVAGAGFSTTGSTLPLTLAAGQSTSISVVFAPTSAGSLSGTATVASNASNSPVAIALTGTGAAATSYSVALGWTSGSSSVVGFNIYRGSQSGGPYTKLNSSLLSAASYTDTSVSAGQTYYYVATDVDSTGDESAYSNVANAVIP
jgi:Cep192 domain 4